MTGTKLGLAIVMALQFGFPGLRPSGNSAPAAPENAPSSGVQAAAASDLFASTVRPVLAAKCAPCHEPGGKMYGSLPFDKGDTIASHREGVLKRLKGDDRAAVERWLASLPPAASK